MPLTIRVSKCLNLFLADDFPNTCFEFILGIFKLISLFLFEAALFIKVALLNL